MDDLLTTRELLELLKVDRTTVYRMLNAGRLSGVKVGGQWRFQRRDVEAMLKRASAEPAVPPANSDFLPLHCVQAVQDVLAEIGAMGAVTTAPDGEPLTRISNACAFCSLLMGSETGRQACIGSWRTLAAQPGHRTEFLTCHAGLQYARARIEVDGSLFAVLIAGQFYAQAPDDAEQAGRVRRLAEAHGIAPARLSEAAQELRVLGGKQLERIGVWLKTVAHTFEDIGHERAELMRRLHRIAKMSTITPSSAD